MKRINTAVVQEKMTKKKITLKEMAEILGYKHASSCLKYLRGESQFKAYHVPVLMQTLELTFEELFYDDDFAEIAK